MKRNWKRTCDVDTKCQWSLIHKAKLFLCGTDVMGFLYDMLRSKLNPASAKPSQTTQYHLRPQNLSCYVSKRARLLQKKIEPSWSSDIEFLWRHTKHLNVCYLHYNSPAGWLSPTETCRIHSCIKHSVNTKKAVDIFLERGMITFSSDPLSSTSRGLFSATHLHVNSGIEWRH